MDLRRLRILRFFNSLRMTETSVMGFEISYKLPAECERTTLKIDAERYPPAVESRWPWPHRFVNQRCSVQDIGIALRRFPGLVARILHHRHAWTIAWRNGNSGRRPEESNNFPNKQRRSANPGCTRGGRVQRVRLDSVRISAWPHAQSQSTLAAKWVRFSCR